MCLKEKTTMLMRSLFCYPIGNRVLLLIALFTILVACGQKENQSGIEEYCGELTGTTIDDQVGRVYSFKDKNGVPVYFIGSSNQDNPGPGYIPCSNNGSYKNYLGQLVIFSGEYRANNQDEDNDPYDPYYTGIDILSVEILEEG